MKRKRVGGRENKKGNNISTVPSKPIKPACTPTNELSKQARSQQINQSRQTTKATNADAPSQGWCVNQYRGIHDACWEIVRPKAFR